MSFAYTVTNTTRSLTSSKDAVRHRQSWYGAHIHTRSKDDFGKTDSLSKRSQLERGTRSTGIERAGLAALLAKKGLKRPRNGASHVDPSDQQQQHDQQQHHQQHHHHQHHHHHQQQQQQQQHYEEWGYYSATEMARPTQRTQFSTNVTQHVPKDLTSPIKAANYVSTLLTERLKQRHTQPHHVPTLEEIVERMEAAEAMEEKYKKYDQQKQQKQRLEQHQYHEEQLAPHHYSPKLGRYADEYSPNRERHMSFVSTHKDPAAAAPSPPPSLPYSPQDTASFTPPPPPGPPPPLDVTATEAEELSRFLRGGDVAYSPPLSSLSQTNTSPGLVMMTQQDLMAKFAVLEEERNQIASQIGQDVFDGTDTY